MEVFRYKRSFKKALLWAALAILFIYRNRASIAYPFFMASTLAILAWDAKSMGKSLIKNIEGKIDVKLFYCISLMLLSINKALTASVDLQWGSGQETTRKMRARCSQVAKLSIKGIWAVANR